MINGHVLLLLCNHFIHPPICMSIIHPLYTPREQVTLLSGQHSLRQCLLECEMRRESQEEHECTFQ